MKTFRTYKGVAAVLNRANIDTDQIIPKQFLKSIRRTGFEDALFFDWRFLPCGDANPEFELNRSAFHGASILVTGNNFGCGSSREHAVWALVQYGFRVIVAPWKGEGAKRIAGFSDIFRNNAVSNGLLLIELPPNAVHEIIQRIGDTRLEMMVDLPAQTLSIHTPPERTYSFSIALDVKERLLNGLDAISMTLADETVISRFEKRHDAQTSGIGFAKK